MSDAVLIIIPTYNERGSVDAILSRVQRALPDATTLVVDDASPDRIGDLGAARHRAGELVQLLSRSQKTGLGGALPCRTRLGTGSRLHSLRRNGCRRVTLARTAAPAPDLPRALRPRHRISLSPRRPHETWPWPRQLLSRAGNRYVRLMLGTSVRDSTSGFRAYRRGVIATLVDGVIQSKGYCFQIDTAWRAQRARFAILEAPTTFTERTTGTSEMGRAIVTEALVSVTRWGRQHRWRQLRARLGLAEPSSLALPGPTHLPPRSGRRPTSVRPGRDRTR